MGAVTRQLVMPHARSFLLLDLRRLMRDPKTVVAFIVVLSVPVIGTLYGANLLQLQMMMSLFLPVIVGWSWGGDLAAGTLAPVAYGAIRPPSLLATRSAAFLLPTLFGYAIAALSCRSDAMETLAALAFAIHLLLLGVLLSSLFRSAECGWLPLFVAFAGVWLPIVSIMKRSGGEIPQPWLHALAVLFAPSIATSLGFASIKGAMLVHLAAALLWAALSIRTIARPGAIR
jgi:hypothetical protein